MPRKMPLTVVRTDDKAFPISHKILPPLKRIEKFRVYFHVQLSMTAGVALSLQPLLQVWVKNQFLTNILLTPHIPQQHIKSCVSLQDLMAGARVLEKRHELDPLYGWLHIISAAMAGSLAPKVRATTFSRLPGKRSHFNVSMMIGRKKYGLTVAPFSWHEFLIEPCS